MEAVGNSCEVGGQKLEQASSEQRFKVIGETPHRLGREVWWDFYLENDQEPSGPALSSATQSDFDF